MGVYTGGRTPPTPSEPLHEGVPARPPRCPPRGLPCDSPHEGREGEWNRTSRPLITVAETPPARSASRRARPARPAARSPGGSGFRTARASAHSTPNGATSASLVHDALGPAGNARIHSRAPIVRVVVRVVPGARRPGPPFPCELLGEPVRTPLRADAGSGVRARPHREAHPGTLHHPRQRAGVVDPWAPDERRPRAPLPGHSSLPRGRHGFTPPPAEGRRPLPRPPPSSCRGP
jgi:hypothetical protein